MKHARETEIGPEETAKLERYVSVLLRWNARINLIARADEAEIWARHVLDSAQLAPLLASTPADLIDLGSGAGFPGLVLAVLTPWRVHLVESDQRKAAFLREAAREAGAEVSVHATRAEDLRISRAAAITARALAPLPKLLAMAAPLLAPGGVCLFPKGRAAEIELTAAAREWHMRVERFPSRSSADSTLLRISEIRRAGP